uniref:Uncharacterized protein n=1 Tax=Glossina palpalis gambiensis TaxID=67801 RepID=A0A1B0C3V3_9MUSC
MNSNKPRHNGFLYEPQRRRGRLPAAAHRIRYSEHMLDSETGKRMQSNVVANVDFFSQQRHYPPQKFIWVRALHAAETDKLEGDRFLSTHPCAVRRQC